MYLYIAQTSTDKQNGQKRWCQPVKEIIIISALESTVSKPATSVPDTYRLRRSEVCEQQRRRPSCAYAQSDQSLYYSPIIIKANSRENLPYSRSSELKAQEQVVLPSLPYLRLQIHCPVNRREKTFEMPNPRNTLFHQTAKTQLQCSRYLHFI